MTGRPRCTRQRGRTVVTVDGHTSISTIRQMSLSYVQTRNVTVGVHEVHHVAIAKRIKVLFPAFRPQEVTVHVDGRLVAQGATSSERGDFSRGGLYVAVSIAVAALGALLSLPVFFVVLPMLLT